MKKSTNRTVESFLIVTFPIALFAGCAAEGNKKPEAIERLTMQDVPTHSAINDSVKTPAAETTHLLIDSLSGYANGSDKSDVSTTESLSEEATTATWINDTVDITEPVENVDQEIAGHLMEVSMNQSNTDTMTEIKKPGLDSINFTVNASEFDEAYLTSLQAHADFLIDNPSLTLTVSGHTDNSGSVKYNKMLSERRALNVYYVLMSYGAPEAQLIMDAFGESSPLNNEGNRQENRRVELEYSDSLVLSAR